VWTNRATANRKHGTRLVITDVRSGRAGRRCGHNRDGTIVQHDRRAGGLQLELPVDRAAGQLIGMTVLGYGRARPQLPGRLLPR
jgi:hypothetical protein